MRIALTVQTSHLVGSEMLALLRNVRLRAAVRFYRFRAKDDAQMISQLCPQTQMPERFGPL